MVNFTKMHGLGNDYIYINNLEGKNEIGKGKIAEFTRYICNRNFGVGADGVILVKKSKVADLKMEIYNADGSQAQMCGNGIRCFGKYVYEKGILNKTQMKIETLGGIKELTLKIKNGIVNQVTVNMGCAVWKAPILPQIIERGKEGITLQVEDLKIQGIATSMGNPHFVIITKNIDDIDVAKYGSMIENNEIFPEKTNVEFIEVLGNTSIKMRVWERGSGETFACGTGACAAFAVCYEKQLVRSETNVFLKGGNLKISLNRYTKEIYMTGMATKICDGSIEWYNKL